MKKLMLNITLVVFLLFICINGFSQKSKIKWLDGEWTGIGFQPSALSQKSWDILLQYDIKTDSFKINYPTFPCGGYWKLVEADNNKATFIEYIAEGKDLCLNGETIVVTKIDDEYITLSYFLPKQFDGVMAFSTLRKKK